MGKATVADHDALLKFPFPPAPSQPLAHRNDVTEPGSDTTLWNPPPLRNVTVSPAAIVRLFGEKVRLDDAVTIWLAAGAIVGKASANANGHARATLERCVRTPTGLLPFVPVARMAYGESSCGPEKPWTSPSMGCREATLRRPV